MNTRLISDTGNDEEGDLEVVSKTCITRSSTCICATGSMGSALLFYGFTTYLYLQRKKLIAIAYLNNFYSFGWIIVLFSLLFFVTYKSR